MDKEALLDELLKIETLMARVSKESRAYRAGEIIKETIIKELIKMEVESLKPTKG